MKKRFKSRGDAFIILRALFRVPWVNCVDLNSKSLDTAEETR